MASTGPGCWFARVQRESSLLLAMLTSTAAPIGAAVATAAMTMRVANSTVMAAIRSASAT